MAREAGPGTPSPLVVGFDGPGAPFPLGDPIRPVLARLEGRPIQVAMRPAIKGHPGADEAVAGSMIRQRCILLHEELPSQPDEFARILLHEIFHFAWVRLSNRARWEWEAVLLAERSRGELGWSAEWRKRRLNPGDRRDRSRAWREYACESFCDTAAWRYAGLE